MDESKTYYNFEIGGTDYFFDDEKCYSWDESISNLHFIRFHSPNLELGILVSKNKCDFLAYVNGSTFTEFLVERGVQLFEYEFSNYNVDDSSQLPHGERCTIDLENGKKMAITFDIYHQTSTHSLVIEDITEKDTTIVRYNISYTEQEMNFNNAFKNSAELIWSEVQKEGDDLPLKFQEFLKKEDKKSKIAGLKILAVVVLVILFFMYVI